MDEIEAETVKKSGGWSIVRIPPVAHSTSGTIVTREVNLVSVSEVVMSIDHVSCSCSHTSKGWQKNIKL